MQRKRYEGGGLAGSRLAVLQRNRTVHCENRPAHSEDRLDHNENRPARNENRPARNENRPARNEKHHNIRRFSPKSRFSSNVVMV